MEIFKKGIIIKLKVFIGGKKMKKLMAIATTMMLAFSAFAAGNLKADDCTVGELAAGKKVTAKGFVINGAQKGGKIEDKSKEPVKNGDKAYSKRIQFKGADGFVEFDVKAGEVVSVVAASSSKTDARAVRITNEGKKLADIAAPAWNADSPSFSSEKVTMKTDGKCVIKGFGGGIYLFEIDVAPAQ